MELQKIQLRVNREGKESWVHFCYVPPATKNKFEREVNTLRQPPNFWIKKWAIEDFGPLELESWDDSEALKEKIRNKYNTIYPNLFVPGNTDHQGWIRVWFTNKLERELKYIV